MGFALVTLLYSMLGGLHASLRTDFYQMLIFLLVLVVLLGITLFGGQFAVADLLFVPFQYDQPGPVLLAVALLQVWSYPMHDPVMMDRGFLADRKTTKRSFLHAAWISVLCIGGFGVLGILAGAHAGSGEAMHTVLARLLGELPMLMFNLALVVSAMSTLDSTLSSSAKLVAVDMAILRGSVRNGRSVMLLFMLLGLSCVFLGNKDLFSAVAVSGTASMYLAPVIFFSLWGKRRDIPLWSYLTSFTLAIGGALLYFFESSGYSLWLGDAHKYTKLLWISLTVLGGGCLAFWLGGALNSAGRDSFDDAEPKLRSAAG
jgi:Na+/proline symporter